MSPRHCLVSLALLTMSACWAFAQAPTEEITLSRPTPVTAPHPIDQAVNFVADGVSFDNPWIVDPFVERGTWFSADYMVMWLRGVSAPPLVTSSPANIPSGTSGVLGNQSTNVLLARETWEAGATSGLRLQAGIWLPTFERLGLEVGGFLTENRSALFNAASDGGATSPSLARPFINAETKQNTAAYTAFPNQQSGTIAASFNTNLWGAEANVLFREDEGSRFRTVYLVGLRYLDLEQMINIQENTTPLGTAAIPNGNVAVTNPDGVRISDNFRTQNQFVGAQFGIRSSWDRGKWNLGLGGKLALGSTWQSQTIVGQTDSVTAGGQVASVTPGGLLANTGVLGTYHREVFSIVPELEVKIGYRVNQNLTLFASYSFLAWTNVVNPANQLNRPVNLTQVPTSGLFQANAGANPSATLNSSNFWANTVQVGLCLKY